MKPSHLIISNIAYLPGVFVEYFEKRGVQCIACDFGTLNGTIHLNHLDEDRKDFGPAVSVIVKRYLKMRSINKGSK